MWLLEYIFFSQERCYSVCVCVCVHVCVCAMNSTYLYQIGECRHTKICFCDVNTIEGKGTTRGESPIPVRYNHMTFCVLRFFRENKQFIVYFFFVGLQLYHQHISYLNLRVGRSFTDPVSMHLCLCPLHNDAHFLSTA